MLENAARVSLVAQPAIVGTCGLCATPATELASIVVIRHERGGIVQFEICGRCTTAVRRLVATFGGQARFVPETLVQAVAEPPEVSVRPPRAPELIHELATHVVDPTGAEYVARVWGQERADGTWIGWLEFIALTSGVRRRTETETTQSNREAVAYWSTGLQPTYLSGAFSRSS